jgi:hypothetical protein
MSQIDTDERRFAHDETFRWEHLCKSATSVVKELLFLATPPYLKVR